MTVFKNTKFIVKPIVRGIVRPDAFDTGGTEHVPLVGSLLIEAGDFFLLETTDELLLE